MKYILAVVAVFVVVSFPVMAVHAQIDVESLGKPLGPDDSIPMIDRYVYFDEGEVTKNAPLNLPVISHEDIMDFANLAIPNALTMSYRNYTQRLPEIEPYFTQSGLDDYYAMVKSVNLLDTLTKHYYVLSGAVQGVPFIAEYDLGEDGIYYWVVDVPLLLSYTQSTTKGEKVFPFNMTVRITVKRVPVGPSWHNVKIDKWSIRS